MMKKIELKLLATNPPGKEGKRKSMLAMPVLSKRLEEIQNRLYAQGKYALLVIFQGMDTSGKDSAVRHVFSGVNPAGCNVRSFKVPTEEELKHHFLWRISKECPQKGMIQIFNRSHYEDLLMPTINGKFSDKQFKERCKEINAFEKGLINNNTIIIKFYLNISHSEQLIRLDERRKSPDKRWKYQREDVENIRKHDRYKSVYNSILNKCSESVAWQIVPADKKWFKDHFILKSILDVLGQYDINYPNVRLATVS